MIARATDARNKTTESAKRVREVAEDVLDLNQRHCRSLRQYSVARQGERTLPPEEAVIVTGSSAEVLKLVDQAPTCLFGVSLDHQGANRGEGQWWAADDVIDQLLVAKEIARWSPKCASVMTGIDERWAVTLSESSVTKVRSLAVHARVFVRWRAKDMRRTMGILSLTSDSTAVRYANARLLMSCAVLRVASRSNIALARGYSR